MRENGETVKSSFSQWVQNRKNNLINAVVANGAIDNAKAKVQGTSTRVINQKWRHIPATA